MKKSKTIANAIAGVLALTTGTSAIAATVDCAERERCYGVVKAGNNDCSTANSSCRGTAKQDFQKDAWMYLPKGTCAKLGGSPKPSDVASSAPSPAPAPTGTIKR